MTATVNTPIADGIQTIYNSFRGGVSTIGESGGSMPGSIPSLALDFAGNKVIDPRITFTRASSATYYGSDGLLKTAATNGARFNHDPATGVSKGLLIEEQRTNLLTYSEQFDNAAWTKGNVTITANAVTAPDGTVTADKFVDTTSTSTHVIYVSNTFAAAAYTFSVYAKVGERTGVLLALWDGTATYGTIFNLSNLSKTTFSVAPTSSDITDIGGGWYRCSITATMLAATGTVNIGVANGSYASYTGDGTSGLYIWGAQLEAGSSPTSYIPTTSAAATRAADVASMTGTNFSSWYNQTEGTVVVSGGAQYDATSGFAALFDVNDTTSNNRNSVVSNCSANVLNIELKTAGSTVAGWYPAYVSGGTTIALAYKTNDSSYAKDGAVAGTTDTSCAMATMSKLDIGTSQGGVNTLNGHIARITYYQTRLSNTTLQALSK